MQGTTHILIVDDDLEIRKLLGRYLTEQGYRVSLASDRRTMYDALATNEISLIVLDVLLPDGSGLDVCRDLRRDDSDVPVILLTALKEDVDRIIGLEIGADDYLGKPFNPRELLARIRAALRRAAMSAAPPREHAAGRVRFAGWTLDTGRRTLVSPAGSLVELTTGEFDLLVALVQHPQQVLSRDQLLDYVHGRSSLNIDRSIDVQVSRLRRKIEADPQAPGLIKTVRNGGYFFTAAVEPDLAA